MFRHAPCTSHCTCSGTSSWAYELCPVTMVADWHTCFCYQTICYI